MPSPVRRPRRAAMAVGGAAAIALVTASVAGAAVTTTEDTPTLAGALVAVPGSLTGSLLAVNYPCVDDNPGTTTTDEGSCPTAVGTTPLAGFPTSGSTYTVMSTGNAALADDPNSSGSSGKDWLTPAADIGSDTYDRQTLRVDLGAATGNCLAFDFRFFSEEYPEFVGNGFNDAFIAQLNTLAITANPTTQTVNAPGNFAAGAGDVISVDGGGPSALTDAAGLGTTYDGATPLLVARTPVTQGATNTLYLTIFDQGDGIYDSAVFLDNLRYETQSAGKCKSLAVDPFEAATGVTQPAGSSPSVTKDKGSVQVPLECTLPSGPVSCTVNGSATFTASGKLGVRTRGAGVPLASGQVTIPASSTGTLVMQTTPAGKKALDKAAGAPKKLLKKAAKLLKKAKAEENDAKAAKLEKKAKKLKKKAKKLKKQPLGVMNVTLSNPSNNATTVITTVIPR